jgi:hypothetical protein
MAPPTPLTLPAELRNKIYEYYLSDVGDCKIKVVQNLASSRDQSQIWITKEHRFWQSPHDRPTPDYQHRLALANTCKTTRQEIMPLLGHTRSLLLDLGCSADCPPLLLDTIIPYAKFLNTVKKVIVYIDGVLTTLGRLQMGPDLVWGLNQSLPNLRTLKIREASWSFQYYDIPYQVLADFSDRWSTPHTPVRPVFEQAEVKERVHQSALDTFSGLLENVDAALLASYERRWKLEYVDNMHQYTAKIGNQEREGFIQVSRRAHFRVLTTNANTSSQEQSQSPRLLFSSEHSPQASSNARPPLLPIRRTAIGLTSPRHTHTSRQCQLGRQI